MAGMISPIQQAAEAVTAGFANFNPENATDLMGMFEGLSPFFEELASLLDVLARKSEDELPVHPTVNEGLREIVATLTGLRDHAEELNGIFREAHKTEIERIENPRPQEELWDVRNNN